ncbi:MAG: M1 family metallopeptidase [Phycisphaerae bacterium]
MTGFLTRRLLLCSTFAMIGFAGCTQQTDRFRRNPGPREAVTVFSAIDLPTPNSIRTASGLPGPDYWQQRVDHDIVATLNEETRKLTATQRIHYTNNSPDPLGYIWLHLEQNLMKAGSDGSQVSGWPRRAKLEDEYGFKIETVRINGSEVPFEVYDTIGRVDLPTALSPRGGKVTLELAWSFVVPEQAPRMGIDKVKDGLIFELAQWFPTPCVYDDVHGWNTLRYLGSGEFYTNFGTYDVTLTVPRDHITVATGVLQNPQEVLTEAQIQRLEQARNSRTTVMIRGADEVGNAGSRPAGTGPLTWHFIAHDVRTFAWASSKAFIWDAASVATRGRVPSEQDGNVSDIPAGTLVQSVYPKEAAPSWEESTDDLRFSIEHYNEQWFPYPYPTATNVNGSEGGMEYPMVIFCGARPREGRELQDTKRGLFGVTAHEIGHNWFPMVVNTDERRHAWMDEGFNSFINHYAAQARYPDAPRSERNRALPARFKELSYQPIMIYADHHGRGTYGLNQYRKTMLGLIALREGVLGPARFDRAFRTYIEAWAFKSPQPADFFRCMETISGQDLAWLWRGWFMETGNLDQAVAKIEQPTAERGAQITFENRGAVVMPMLYRVTYEDGATEDRRLPVEAWFASDQKVVVLEDAAKEVSEVVIDPEEIFPDVDRTNNQRKAGKW